jgi:hypothetical protein
MGGKLDIHGGIEYISRASLVIVLFIIMQSRDFFIYRFQSGLLPAEMLFDVVPDAIV